MTPRFETDDLIKGLKLFGDRYHALEVFADDLSETARSHVGLKSIVTSDGRTYAFTVFPERGAVRLELVPDTSTDRNAALDAAVDSNIGAAIDAAVRAPVEAAVEGAVEAATRATVEAATRATVEAAVEAATQEKGEAIVGGALLGLLVGGLIGAAADGTRPRRIFAMQLDPASRHWTAYDGTLVRWMKERLLVPNCS